MKFSKKKMYYLTELLDFGTATSNDAADLALMDQKPGVWIADSTCPLSADFWNLDETKQILFTSSLNCIIHWICYLFERRQNIL